MTTMCCPTIQESPASTLGMAESRYAAGGDIQSLVSAYEQALSDVKLDCDDARIRLIGLYIEAGDASRAWNYMNTLCMTHPHLRAKVRAIQCDLFKAAGRWTDAISVLMQSHLLAFKDTDYYDRDGFVRDCTQIAANLNWDADRVETFACILDCYVDVHNVDESLLRRESVQTCMQFLAADERGW